LFWQIHSAFPLYLQQLEDRPGSPQAHHGACQHPPGEAGATQPTSQQVSQSYHFRISLHHVHITWPEWGRVLRWQESRSCSEKSHLPWFLVNCMTCGVLNKPHNKIEVFLEDVQAWHQFLPQFGPSPPI
jgi:hypothetical protein